MDNIELALNDLAEVIVRLANAKSGIEKVKCLADILLCYCRIKQLLDLKESVEEPIVNEITSRHGKNVD